VTRATSSRPAPIWQLSIRTPDGNVTSREFLPPRLIVLGREPTCDVALRSPHVSRRHAEIDFRDDGAWLSDTSSSGTLVGEQLLSRTTVEIEPEAPIQIGPFQLRVSLLQPPVDAEPSYSHTAPAPDIDEPDLFAPPAAATRTRSTTDTHPRAPAPPPAADPQALEAADAENYGTAHVSVANRRAMHRASSTAAA